MASSMQRLLGKSTGRLGAVFYEVLPCLSVLRCWSVKSVRSVKLANWFGHVPASDSPCQSSHPLSVAWTELLKRSWIRNTHRDTSWHRDLIIVHTTKKHKETKLQTDQSCVFLGTPCLSPQSVPICPMWPMWNVRADIRTPGTWHDLHVFCPTIPSQAVAKLAKIQRSYGFRKKNFKTETNWIQNAAWFWA